MTRFLLSLEDAVDTILAAVAEGRPGETYIPRVPSARVDDLADVLIGDRAIETVVTGIRPGEKLHEILVTEEEGHRTLARGDYYVIAPMLPELQAGVPAERLEREYSSSHDVMDRSELGELLRGNRLLIDDERAGELIV
jgi:UDP-glucose 4-epimerase